MATKRYKLRQHNRVDVYGKPDPENSYQDILDQENKCAIPMDDSNTDYLIYKEWVAKGNTPEPAD